MKTILLIFSLLITSVSYALDCKSLEALPYRTLKIINERTRQIENDRDYNLFLRQIWDANIYCIEGQTANSKTERAKAMARTLGKMGVVYTEERVEQSLRETSFNFEAYIENGAIQTMQTAKAVKHSVPVANQKRAYRISVVGQSGEAGVLHIRNGVSYEEAELDAVQALHNECSNLGGAIDDTSIQFGRKSRGTAVGPAATSMQFGIYKVNASAICYVR